MDNPEIKCLKDFFEDTILKFYRMGLQTSGKNFDDVMSTPDVKTFWQKKNGANRTFGKRLNQLLKQKR